MKGDPMNKMRLILLLAALLGVGLSGLGQETLSNEALLASLDAARFFGDDVTTLRIRIHAITPDGERDADILLRFADTAGDAARIEFLSPEELAGQIYLSTPDGTYFFGPDLDFPIKTSATAEVFGDAAVAQTSGIRFLDSYTVAERRFLEGPDGADLLEVDLEAIDFSVAFQAATVTVDLDALRPVSVILYALSGIPFYEVFYETYEMRGADDLYVVRQRIVNLFLVGRETTSEIVEIGDEAVDPTLFDPNELGGDSTG
jgi:outer membrane lipoprotein-sorting protein